MQRQHPHPRLQQPLDQHTITALDRYDLNLEADQRIAQRPDPQLVVRKRFREQPIAGVIGDQDIVLLRRPINPSTRTHTHQLLPLKDARLRPDREVPLRVLIDKALESELLPVTARGTSPPPGRAGPSQAHR